MNKYIQNIKMNSDYYKSLENNILVSKPIDTLNYHPMKIVEIGNGTSLINSLKPFSNINAIHLLNIKPSNQFKTLKSCPHRIDDFTFYVNPCFKSFKGFPISITTAMLYVNNKNILYATLPQFNNWSSHFRLFIMEWMDDVKAYNHISFNDEFIYKQLFERFNNAPRTKWDIRKIIARYKYNHKKLVPVLDLIMNHGYVKYIPLKTFKKIDKTEHPELFTKLYSLHPYFQKNYSGLSDISKIISGEYYGVF